MRRYYQDDGDERPVVLDGGARKLLKEFVQGRLRWKGFAESEQEALLRIRAALRSSVGAPAGKQTKRLRRQ